MKSTAVFLLALATRAYAQCPDGTPFAGTGGVNCFINPCDGASCGIRGATCGMDPCQGCDAIWTIRRGTGTVDVTDRCSGRTTTAPVERTTERECQGGMCPGIFQPVCTIECNQYPNRCSAEDCNWPADQINDGACARDCVAGTSPPTPPPTRGSFGCQGITCPAGIRCDGRACNRMLNQTCAGGISYSNPCHALSCGFEERDISIGRCPSTTRAPPVTTTQGCGEMFCPGVWDPVCSTDGTTYGNSCEARNCRATVASTGACVDTTVAPPTGPRPAPTPSPCPICSPMPPQPGCWNDYSDQTVGANGCLIYPCGQMMCSSTTVPDVPTRGPPNGICATPDRQCPIPRCALPIGCEMMSGGWLPNTWDRSGNRCCACMPCAFQRVGGGQCPGHPIADSCGAFAWPTVAPSTDAPTFPMATFSPTSAPRTSEPTGSPAVGFGLSSCGASTAPRIQAAARDASYFNNAVAPVVIPAFADFGCSTLATAFVGYQWAGSVTLELFVDGAAVGTDYTFEYSEASSSMTIRIYPVMAAAVNYPAQLNATDGRGSSVVIAEWPLVVRVMTAPPATASPTPDRRYTTVPATPAVPAGTIPADVSADVAVTDARDELIDAQNELNGLTAAYNDYAAQYQAGEPPLTDGERNEMIRMANTDLPNRRRNLAAKQASYDAAIAAASAKKKPAKSTGKKKEAGADVVTVVAIIVIGLVVVGAIVVFAMVQMKKKSNYADGRNFSNPTYDGISAASPGMGAASPGFGAASPTVYEHNTPTPHYDDDDVDV